MTQLLRDIERFLRQLVRMSPDSKREHSRELGEASQMLADRIELELGDYGEIERDDENDSR